MTSNDRIWKCAPQELAVILSAFDKIGKAYGCFASPSDVGFKSKALNDIVFTLPKLKEPMKELLGDISLKRAAEGRKDAMWNDPDRYPTIADADLVSSQAPFPQI
jgi:DNA mismatch repair protein MSH3